MPLLGHSGPLWRSCVGASRRPQGAAAPRSGPSQSLRETHGAPERRGIGLRAPRGAGSSSGGQVAARAGRGGRAPGGANVGLGEQLREAGQAGPSPADSTTDALLTAADGAEDSEAEASVDSAVEAAEAAMLQQQRLEEEAQLERNPYTPEDAASAAAPPPGRWPAGLPASAELEQLLAAAEAQGGDVSLEQLQGLFPFKLDGFQAKAVQQLLEGRSVVVCAPTGAGKTAIAEAAAAAALARGRRVIYTTPLKALSNQKLSEKAARFGSSRCGLQTGDTSLNPDADIVVMTTEILRNIMYRTAEVVGSSTGATRDGRLGDVGLVVLDEVHYLGDPWRGSVWEEVIINCPKHIQILAMSATVKNPQDLGGWISQVHRECVTIQTRFRPVPLRWVFAHKAPRRGAVLEDLLAPPPRGPQQQAAGSGGGSSSSSSSSALQSARLNPRLRMEEWVAEEVRFQALREQREARQRELLLSSSGLGDAFGDLGGAGGNPGGNPGGRYRRSDAEADRAALTRRVMAKRVPTQDQVLRALLERRMLPAIWFIMSRRDCDLAAIATTVALVDEREEAELEAELQQLFSDNPDAVREKLVPALLRGVASHHAGCLPAWKGLVERCFQRGLLKLVFATGTLAAGINMPARTTIISGLARRADDGIALLPHNELLQMAGRAGRRGYDTQGHCVLVQGRFEGAEVAHQIITAGPEPLQSQFTTGYSLVLNLLSAYSLEEAREFLSKSFGTYLSHEGNKRLREEAAQLSEAAAALVKLAGRRVGLSEQQQAAAAAVKRQKSSLLHVRQRATLERCAAVQQLLAGGGSEAAAEPEQQQHHQQQLENGSSSSSSNGSSSSSSGGFPALLLLNLSRHPNDSSQPAQLLPALAVSAAEAPPLPPTSRSDAPPPPVLLCLGADNRRLAVSAQHVVGALRDRRALAEVLGGQEEALRRLVALMSESHADHKVWANLSSKMFSCQVTLGSALTSALALRLNLPPDAFSPVGPTAETAALIEAQQRELAAAKAALQRARKADEQQRRGAGEGGGGGEDGKQLLALLSPDGGTAGGSGGSGSDSDDEDEAEGGAGDGAGPSAAGAGVGGSKAVAAALRGLKGRDPLLLAKRLLKRAKQLTAEADDVQATTWNSFMDVLGILVKLGAMEEATLRLLPLGLVARGINCNNELWMAAAISHPSVINLTPPQLAAFVGALVCSDTVKRPMSVWSGFQVSEAVVSVLEELEPTMDAIYQAQTEAGQMRWNEHLAVDLRLAGLVEAWAAGVSWQEVMADTSMDDGDMARLLARTADMLKQMTFLDDQLPWLTDNARAALRGMDRKPISDLVA